MIYNYVSLRNELIKKGYSFTSDGDTEVIIKAYHFYGSKCLDKIDGVFSFCIYNLKNKKLFIARDRFGINTPFAISRGDILELDSYLQKSLSAIFNAYEIRPKISPIYKN